MIAIVTTVKVPDTDTYWRCATCGEMWNVSRTRNHYLAGRRWRWSPV